MGISRSLTTGESALSSQQMHFDVISNNIANLNTTGYKSSRANFSEQLNQIYSYGTSPDTLGGKGIGGTNPYQFGLGVKLGSISKNLSQGVIESTGRPLDMALQGDGYFIYNKNGNQLFSRAGAISQDKDGSLVDSTTGAFLQGYNVSVDANGKTIQDSNGVNVLNRTLSNLKIPDNVLSPPRQTQKINVTGNLNSASDLNSQRQTSINIYDNAGGSHTLSLNFTKTANANEFSIDGTLDGNKVTLSAATIKFNNDGTLNTPNTLTVKASDLNTALGSKVFDEGTPKDLTITLADPNNLLSGITQFSGPNTATATQQDGYQSGSLTNLSVDSDGKILGSFTNGQSEVLGQVAISKFVNPAALTDNGGNFYSVSPNSGLPNIGTAGEIFPSTTIAGSSLEQSNVELTSQFTDMITTQRAFEAASRTITVTDQMLQEITSLKR